MICRGITLKKYTLKSTGLKNGIVFSENIFNIKKNIATRVEMSESCSTQKDINLPKCVHRDLLGKCTTLELLLIMILISDFENIT